MSDTPTPPTIAKKVLIIEDEQLIAALYQRALGTAGYAVTLEHDGQRGLELAQTDRFDIILLDLMIPTITGSEVLERLRSPAQTPPLHAKIIIITNLEQRPPVRATIEAQADGYLIKAAITPHELVDYLKPFS